MSEVHLALAKVQAEMEALKKSATNPHFRSKYIPLEEIVAASDPLFEKFGLLFYATPTYIDGPGTPAISYTLVHLESNTDIRDTMPLVLDKQNSQGVGSAITYARRYILTSLLNIIADVDDDGNAASSPPSKRGGNAAPKPVEFADEVKATGKKAAEIREWAALNGATLDDVGVDAAGLRKYLNGLSEGERKDLLAWANGN